MFAEIITIGDEILIGQVVDTNSTFIAKELNKIGVSVFQITSVQDDKEHILNALKEAEERVKIVIVTGGLGPTKDDITKHTFCTYFKDTLVENMEVLNHVEELFKKYSNSAISDLNRRQALVPSKAVVLHNANGTAPGMWMEQNGVVFISLPGVPFEMRGLIQDSVIPKIQSNFKRPHILHKTLVTYGMGESAIAEKLDVWEDALPENIKLAYLPNLGNVRLRLTGKGKSKEELIYAVAEQVEKLYALIGDIIFGEEENEILEVIIGNLLTKKGFTLATAESFTGGKIAQELTSIPGASSYFKGSVVSYATETKIKVLGVSEELINKYSVVSEEVAKAMASNVAALLNADFAIATTGNAGPAKGDSDSDMGTVYIAICTPTHVFANKYTMGSSRERVVIKSVNKAFELLQKEILKF